MNYIRTLPILENNNIPYQCRNCGTFNPNPHRDADTPVSSPPLNPTKLLLTVEEAAQRLSIGRPKMYELIMRGIVLSVKIGASRRIPTTALEAYVEQLSRDAARDLERREDHGK